MIAGEHEMEIKGEGDMCAAHAVRDRSRVRRETEQGLSL
jgi:hypothetical protein